MREIVRDFFKYMENIPRWKHKNIEKKKVRKKGEEAGREERKGRNKEAEELMY